VGVKATAEGAIESPPPSPTPERGSGAGKTEQIAPLAVIVIPST
jgi:hypothetical protein